MANMKQLYDFVDKSIKQGLSKDNLQAIISLTPKEEQLGALFDIPTTQQYILRRFINACMSTDQQIREYASDGLKKWVGSFQIKPNLEKLVKYIIQTSNYKKASNRKSESDAYATGRVLVISSLCQFLKNNSQIMESLVQILKDFKQIQQQTIQACHLICRDKVFKLKFSSLSPEAKTSKFLYKLLLKVKDSKSQPVDMKDFPQILEQQTNNYPKFSTILYNFGKYLHIVTDSPFEFFRSYANKFLDNDSEADIHEIYSILTVLKGFLSCNQITLENYRNFFDKKIMSVWLEQLRVLNKKLKGIAKSISINFQNNDQLAYQILVDLHEQGVYLDNISINHPFAKLYEYVKMDKYWSYLYDLCTNCQNSETQVKVEDKKKNKNEGKLKSKNNQLSNQNQKQEQSEQPEEQKKTFYNEFEYFSKLRFLQLTDSQLCSSITLLLNRYILDEKRKQLLFLCINLLNVLCKVKKEKKTNQRKLNKKMIIILNSLNFGDLRNLDEEKVQRLKKAVLWIKKKTLKNRKQEGNESSQTEIDFLNFYSCLLFFCLIYPEQIDTCDELQLVHKDLLTLEGKKSQKMEGKPQKRVKKQQNIEENENNKPIHVLTDIFISLMTKPPLFLRKSIHNLFGSLINFLDATDITNILAVITTSDAEFIEEI